VPHLKTAHEKEGPRHAHRTTQMAIVTLIGSRPGDETSARSLGANSAGAVPAHKVSRVPASVLCCEEKSSQTVERRGAGSCLAFCCACACLCAYMVDKCVSYSYPDEYMYIPHLRWHTFTLKCNATYYACLAVHSWRGAYQGSLRDTHRELRHNMLKRRQLAHARAAYQFRQPLCGDHEHGLA
jgi:hypothetical protein